MAKTNPIGVRFDKELLNKLKESSLALSPQKALNLYEKVYSANFGVTISDLTKPTNLVKPKEPLGSQKSNFTVDTKPKVLEPTKYEMSEKDIRERIEELEKELKNVPSNPLVGRKTWIWVREKELSELKNKII